jgi:hypothetical protein
MRIRRFGAEPLVNLCLLRTLRQCFEKIQSVAEHSSRVYQMLYQSRQRFPELAPSLQSEIIVALTYLSSDVGTLRHKESVFDTSERKIIIHVFVTKTD